MFTTEHYQFIAAEILAEIDACEAAMAPRPDNEYLKGRIDGAKSMARNLARKFADDNSRFDGYIFFKACGMREDALAERS